MAQAAGQSLPTTTTLNKASKRSIRAGEYHDHDFDFAEIVPIGQVYDVSLYAYHANRGSVNQPSDTPEPAPTTTSTAALSTVTSTATKSGEDSLTGGVAQQCASNKGIGTAWETFHAKHSGSFFQRRRYLLHAFPQLLPSSDPNAGDDTGTADHGVPKKSVKRAVEDTATTAAAAVTSVQLKQKRGHVVEFGCGCGSSILTVLLANPEVTATAVDISASAIARLNTLLDAEGLRKFCTPHHLHKGRLADSEDIVSCFVVRLSPAAGSQTPPTSPHLSMPS